METRRAAARRQKPSSRSKLRPPAFEAGILREPLLAFGGRHEHVDPKTGLALYGPYSLTGQSRPPVTSITVGIVGPPAMVADAQRWLDACRGVLVNDGSQPFLYPHFPGFNGGLPFQCELVFGETWNEVLRVRDIEEAIAATNFLDRVSRVMSLYVAGVRTLTQREPTPQVILCCIPQDVIDYCTTRTTSAGEPKRVKVSKAEKAAQVAVSKGQQFLFREMNPALGLEDEDWEHENLRRGLKAEAMQFGIPTQIVWPRTLLVAERAPAPGERRSQDIATRAWNFTTALYHKAGGSPWRLAEMEPGACFVGISFYRELTEKNPRMRTSMAQAFTAAGDGYVLRGHAFEWDSKKWGRSAHLDQATATALLRGVLDLYAEQNRGSLPTRLVIHKSSRFWDEELAGIEEACGDVPRKDLVAFGRRGIQFYRTGDYPALRGTYVQFSDSNFLLYTDGYIPFLRTYPGPRVPQPLEILEHHGDSPWDVILQEILALTKMNWNTADFACSEPITIAFSRRVGHILAELPPDLAVRSEYRFYM